MAGWYHQLNGLEFDQTLGDHEVQASLACCSQWGRKDSDTHGSTEEQQSLVFHLALMPESQILHIPNVFPSGCVSGP